MTLLTLVPQCYYSSMDPVEPLVERALARSAPLAAIDVRARTAGYDPKVGRRRNGLEILAVLAVPGDDDSRYTTQALEWMLADDLPAAVEVMALARELAARLGVPLHPASGEPPRADEKGWVELQGPPPERTWKMTFRTLAWSADGTERHASGEISVLADSGHHAIYEAQSEITRDRAPPFRYWVDTLDTGRQGSCYHVASYPDAAPPKDTLRSWGAEGRSPSNILRALAAEAPALSPLDRMVALEAAFNVELSDLAPVSAFYAGRLSDAALDSALEPALLTMFLTWMLPLALRKAQAAGESIAPVLHEFYPQVGIIGLAKGVIEAFDVGIPAVKTLVDTACDGKSDEQVKVMLNAVLKAQREASPGVRLDWDDECRVMRDALEQWLSRAGATP